MAINVNPCGESGASMSRRSDDQAFARARVEMQKGARLARPGRMRLFYANGLGGITPAGVARYLKAGEIAEVGHMTYALTTPEKDHQA